MKKLTKTIITALIASSLAAPALSAYEKVHISVNGTVTDIDARLIGSTTYVDIEDTKRSLGAASGENLEIHAEVGEPYIACSGRYIGGNDCLELDGEIFVPVRSLAKIYGADVEWTDETRSVALTLTGTALASGDDFYIADEVYWLSRIINAEAEGEPMEERFSSAT